MLELTYLRELREEATTRLKKRNIDAEALVAKAVELDGARRTTQNALDAKQADLNTLSRSIGDLMKSGQKAEAETARAKTTDLKTEIARLQDELNSTESALRDQLCLIPNAPNAKVPPGKTPEENVTVMQEGPMPSLPADAKPHWELGEEYGLLHMDLGVKVTGAGFPVYSGQGAKLQRSLISFFLDRAIAAGYR